MATVFLLIYLIWSWQPAPIISDPPGPPAVLITRKDSPVNNLTDLINLAKAKPGQLTYGLVGAGCEPLDRLFGVEVITVPIGGTGPALKDLAAGKVDLLCDVVSNVKRQIDVGAVKALAILNKEKRSAELPDVPTARELGFRIP